MRHLTFFFLIFCVITCQSQVKERGGGGTDTRATVKGEKRALIIGISDYEHDTLDLTYADDDANLFKDYLVNVDKVKEDHIIFLENSNAHAQAIYQGIDEIIKVSKDGDEVYIYFAGHGDVVNREEEKIGFLLAHDVNGGRNYRGTDGVVALTSLNTFINILTTAGVNVILVLDACHSGFIYEEGAKTNMLTLSDGNNFMNTTKLLSCAPSQTSQEDASIGHGFFTYYLVMGMMGAADVGVQDNKLKYSELDDFVYEAVAGETQDQQEPFMISGQRRKVFKTLSSETKTIALQAREKSIFLKDAVRNARSSIDNTSPIVQKLNSEQKRFNEALKKGQLYGKPDSALEILKNARAQGILGPVELSRMRFTLSRKLTSPANQLINLYISGPKDLPLGKEFLKESKNIKKALELLDQDHPTRKALEVSARFLEAYSYIRDDDYGNYLKAELLLKEALKIESRAAYVFNALGILANERSEYESAKNYYNQAEELIPTWSYPINNLGTNYFEQYDYGKAQQLFEKAISVNNKSETPVINLAAIANNIGREKEALASNLNLINNNVNSYTVYSNAASILNEKENIKAAQQLFEKAMIRFPKSPYLLTKYSNFILSNKLSNLDPESYLIKALEIQPNYAAGITEYADYLRTRKPSQEAKEEAKKLYQKAININPNYMWSYAGLGYLLHSQKTEGAIAAFELGITNNPGKVEALYNYARFKENQLEDTNGAVELYLKVLELNKYHKNAYQKLANIYLNNYEAVKATELIESYIQTAGENPVNLKLLGDVFYRQKDLNQAAIYYQKSVDTDPSYTLGTASLAYTYLEIGSFNKAEKYYTQAHEENPVKYEFETFQSTLFRKARELENLGNNQKSLEILELAFRLKNNEESTYKYALSLYLNGEASISFDILNKINPESSSWIKKFRVLKIKQYVDMKQLEKASQLFSIYENDYATTDKALKLLLMVIQGKKKEAQELKSQMSALYFTASRLSKNYSKESIDKITKL